jgi:1,4-alpha-glucan branching enzyme
MMSVPVGFRYEPGLSFAAFSAATLFGSWDSRGQASSGQWSSRPMDGFTTPDGSTGFTATVDFDPSAVGKVFSWGVQLQLANGSAAWGIFREVPDQNSTDQNVSFVLAPGSDVAQRETYRVSWHRARGVQRFAGPSGDEHIVFSAWAPDAQAVEVVFGGPAGYIADDGHGGDVTNPLPLTQDRDGVWSTSAAGFAGFVDRRYMYRVTRDNGSINWATDMFSRQQVGTGDFDPQGAHYDGPIDRLDGRPSASAVTDTSTVYPYPLPPPGGGHTPTPVAEFWADEVSPERPVPHRVEDLVIYELHVGALNPAVLTAGTFSDALALLPYLLDLGINAIELMPMFQFDGSLSWGYGSSQFLAIDSSAGGRDALKQFVKTCHQQGIAVLMDVVYNHYTPEAGRAAWQYDSVTPSRNCYYWYEGIESQYPDPTGGYLDNDSSGWAPRYSEPHVRALFVSSAVLLADEFHIDGLRVDQTASIHSYNSLHANGQPVGSANVCGRKFLRELCQTMKTVQPREVMIAEDHSGWSLVTQPAPGGGIGFDATWYVDFYHHLIGENGRGPEWAKLLLHCGQDATMPLAMAYFAGALAVSGNQKVVYHSNHDEAGNDQGTERTILVAVNGAPLVGTTRRYAEARCRFACAMTMLSAGTPMFLMGDEVGAEKAYTYDKFFENKEDLEGLRQTTGAHLFAFYQAIIAFRLGTTTIRGHNIEVIHTNDLARVIAFRRWDDQSEYLIAGSLNNTPFNNPNYLLSHSSLGVAGWRECFNSDAASFGGDNVGNQGATLQARAGTLAVVVPANGVIVLERTQ